MKTTKSGSYPPSIIPELQSYSHFWIRNHLEEIKNKPPSIIYRPINKSELKEIKALHKEWFPINYSDALFDMIGSSLYSIAAVFDTKEYGESEIIFAGLILFRVSHNESNGFLRCTYFMQNTYSCYIITIGVIEELRCLGIGSELILRMQRQAESLIEMPLYIYLHVVVYNNEAIAFYERKGFIRAEHISDHYYIDGKFYDAYLYIFYINNAKTPIVTWENVGKMFKSIMHFPARVKSLFVNQKIN
ncbi:unnamed protein product [Blepharisma stoltei]|uniref:N-alpha-acetyltransferase 60 n=1 Tax=Blepharisma stoltei TaxID=1481888 RepID=A0AAU9JHN0_9CILI|nr:unnamed protein product [Blepharisma stoltei]